jgi:hypothetical protein
MPVQRDPFRFVETLTPAQSDLFRFVENPTQAQRDPFRFVENLISASVTLSALWKTSFQSTNNKPRGIGGQVYKFLLLTCFLPLLLVARLLVACCLLLVASFLPLIFI